MNFFKVWLVFFFIETINSFIPSKLIEMLVDETDETLRMNFGEVSYTLVHEDIIKRGIVRSVAKYFYEKSNSNLTKKIDLNKLKTGQYYDVKSLFDDFHGNSYCSLEFELVIKKDFQKHVSIVDFDEKTKDGKIKFILFIFITLRIY